MVEQIGCRIIFPSFGGGDPEDDSGCILPDGHEGKHKFIDRQGQEVTWETDWDCPCCVELEPSDYCVTYTVANAVLPTNGDD